MLNRKKLSCDLCVIGGGIAGIGAAGENNRETSINEYAHPLHASRMERASHQRRHGKPQAGSVQRLRELLVS